MIDPRMSKLADLLVKYSTCVQAGEKVLIDSYEAPAEMVEELIEAVVKAGGVPFAEVHEAKVTRALLRSATQEQMSLLGARDLAFMKDIQCYIALRGGMNASELADVPDARTQLADEFWRKPVQDQRVNHTKWVVLRWPTPAMAQLAKTSTRAFEDFYFRVCTLDYEKMAKAVEPLRERMQRTDRVHIHGPLDTELTFSIKGIPSVPCVGERNIPDGECYTAPVRDSVDGVIHYNVGTIYRGKSFDNVRLVFKNGKIVEATSSDTKGLNEILDSDEGARFIGEFALGFNPFVLEPMYDTLFDEKIAGSLHFTPGQSYHEASNGNSSKVHWDLVLVQRPEYGGGEIRFDGELIRKDGIFQPDYLKGLNPEQLGA